MVSAAFAAFLIADAIAGTWLAFREKSARDVADRNAALAAESAGRASAEAEIAEKARLAAEAQRKLADEQRQRAEAEKARADANAAEAERRRAEADSERKRAEKLSDQAERRVYSMQIAGAQRDWEANSAESAWAHLDKCRRELRGWEHDYLFTLFTQNQKTFKGHKSPVMGVAFRSDGNRIASGSWDGTVNVWDAASGRVILTLDAQTGPVACVAFSSDGADRERNHGSDGPGLGRDQRAGVADTQRAHPPDRERGLQPGRQSHRQRKLGPDRQGLGHRLWSRIAHAQRSRRLGDERGL